MGLLVALLLVTSAQPEENYEAYMEEMIAQVDPDKGVMLKIMNDIVEVIV